VEDVAVDAVVRRDVGGPAAWSLATASCVVSARCLLISDFILASFQ